MGVHQPDAGTITLDGEEIIGRSVGEHLNQGIAMIFQELSPSAEWHWSPTISFLGRDTIMGSAGGWTAGRCGGKPRDSSNSMASR